MTAQKVPEMDNLRWGLTLNKADTVWKEAPFFLAPFLAPPPTTWHLKQQSFKLQKY